MAIIAQKRLFGWEEIEDLGDLQRLQLVLQYLPDEGLMRVLEEERYRGRNEYPVRAVWNSVLAGVVYEHASVQSLRRELNRNGQLRQVCGFEVERGADAVPPSWAYSRFLRTLMKHQEEIDELFVALVEGLREELEDFGEYLVVDASYELPVSYRVTAASVPEIPVAQELCTGIKAEHPEVIKRCTYGIADRGYDDGKLIKRLWEEYGIKPVIGIRNLWKDGEETKALTAVWNVVYSYDGRVYCENPNGEERREMAYGGFERKRQTLKYRCPAKHYGYECSGQRWCGVGAAIRIPLEEDRRVFTPLVRSSYRWKTVYKKRTAVERVNSRLDVSFGFERHYIRGLQKMQLRCSIALCVMLAMALGQIREKQKEKMRSLVQAVA
jgi:hypothetical protein